MRNRLAILAMLGVSMLFLSCGGEEPPAPGQEPQLSESSVGEQELALTGPVWTYQSTLRSCGSCSGTPCVCNGAQYQNYLAKPCSPVGATMNVCFNYRCGSGQIAQVWQLVCK